LESLKFAWSGRVAFVRFFSEAKTRRYPPGRIVMSGKDHFLGRVGSSVRDHPDIGAGWFEELWTSIQSESVPSSSRIPPSLSARNSFSRRPAALRFGSIV
jgi:hypothetical protein